MKKTKKLALCAILSALGAVILFIGSVIDVLDLSSAMFASMLILFVVVEIGGAWTWLTYSVTALTGILLLPNKLPAVIYILVGYYPIVKEKLERLPRLISWIAKLFGFNLSLIAVFGILKLFFSSVSIELFPGMNAIYTYIIYFSVGNLIFVLYDVLLTRLVSFYILKLRKRLRIDRKK